METQNSGLTDDQKNRMRATLERIRAGLSEFGTFPAIEPAHIFEPEVFDDHAA